MEINNIVIVGGGSAGWMTAAILIKSFPEKNITVVESPDIPTVGVGESTYDGINFYLKYLEIDKEDFFKYTDASIKLGIDFVNFYDKDDSSFLYPFGLPDIQGTRWGFQDWMIKKSLNKNIPNTDFAESYFPSAHLIKYNTFNENLNNELGNFDTEMNTAFHFDATKFSLWLKNRYSLPRGVKNITLSVKDICLKNNGIDYLILENNQKIFADLFIDCTGFKSLLLSEKLKEPFISYNDKLPNNRAWATRIPYIDQEMELESTTRCTAIENGWVWNIPLYSRLGSGYVYSDNFIDPETALDEFKNYLSSKHMKIPRTKSIIDKLEFNDIKMRVGIHKRTWVKNVVAIGLSAGFIEPLESNGLFTVHEFLFQLIKTLSKGKVNSWDIACYNAANKDLYDSFINFIRMHYALSVRDDTKYWKNNISREFSFENISENESYSDYLLFLYRAKMKTFETPEGGGFPTGVVCISTGMNFYILDEVSTKLTEMTNSMNYKNDLKTFFNELERKKNVWDKVAKNSHSLFNYLNNKYYKEEN